MVIDKKIIFLIPALNEQKNIKKTIINFKKYGKVLVVDDGSIDKTKNIALKYSNYFLFNKKNMGYDFSIYKGIEYIRKKLNFDLIVVIDGDGQHSIKNIKKIKKLPFNTQIAVGTRKIKNRIAENMVGYLSKFIFCLNDPFCGLKVYSKLFIKKAKNYKNINCVGTYYIAVAKIEKIKVYQFDVTIKKSSKVSSFDNKAISGNIRIILAFIRLILISFFPKRRIN